MLKIPSLILLHVDNIRGKFLDVLCQLLYLVLLLLLREKISICHQNFYTHDAGMRWNPGKQLPMAMLQGAAFSRSTAQKGREETI